MANRKRDQAMYFMVTPRERQLIATNNLNQIARRANETRSVYAADVEDMQARYAELWEAANKILLELAQIS